MKRNCYLDRPLHSSSSYSPTHRSMNETLNVHNGRHCFFDIVELKARVILWSASREMEESSELHLQSEALLMYVSRGLSIKKSLQNFLQKRKRKKISQRNISNHND